MPSSDRREGGPNTAGATFLAAVVSALLFYVVVLILRRRWRAAAARAEEVRLLVQLAAEESQRAEQEYLLQSSSRTYVENTVYIGPTISAATAEVKEAVGTITEAGTRTEALCAVCFRPTNNRCSQCKAVKYCSGKCQIIHWRQGHKDQCRPLQNIERRKDSSISSDGVVQLDKASEFLESDGAQGNVSSESNSISDLFTEDDNLEDTCSVDTSGTENTSRTTFSLSYSPSRFSRSLGSGDVSSSVDPVQVDDARQVENISSDHLITSTMVGDYVSDTKLSKHPSSGETIMSSSVGSVSCSSVLRRKASGGDDEEVHAVKPNPESSSSVVSTSLAKNESRRSTSVGDPNSSLSEGSVNAESTKCNGEVQLSDDCQLQTPYTSSGKSVYRKVRVNDDSHGADALESPPPSKCTPDAIYEVGKNQSSSAWRSNTVPFQSYNSSRSVPLFSATPSGHATTILGEFAVPCSKPVVDRPIAISTVLHDRAHLVENSNSFSNLKTSVERVLQSSKEYLSGATGRDIIRQHNHKESFPYDRFVKLYNNKVELRPFGLTNCGNGCYANAVLQCLAFTRPLTAYLLEGLHSKTCPKNRWCFTCEFESLISQAKQGKSPISPIGILSHIHSIGSSLGRGREEDAHEFLRYAIDAMQSICLKEARSNSRFAEGTTLIQLTFGGFLRSKIKCLRCQGKSERQEPMMDLTVEIDGNIGSLAEALARFTNTETLDGENKYQCERCKSYEKAKKKLTILEAPNILTIALKRFQSGKFGKLNKAVRFPEYLNLAPYMSRTDDKSPVYMLYGVVVHLDIMNAAFSGHYVCYVKNMQGKWYKVDDSTVKPVDLDTVLSKGAYLLLYARYSPRAPMLIRNSSSRASGSSKWSTDRDKTHFTSHPFSSSAYKGRYAHGTADSSSENSSLLSCSDEGSWTTDSTRDSTSTDEFSDYNFGDPGSWRSSLHLSEDSDDFAFSPFSSWHSDSSRVSDSPSHLKSSYQEDVLKNKSHLSRGVASQSGDPSFLYTDLSRESRNLTEHSSSRGTEWSSNSYEVKPSLTMRRPSSDRTTQTFYR